MAVSLADHPLQQLEGGGPVAPVDGIGEVPRRHAAVVAEERLDLGGREPRSGPVGGAQEVEQAEQPARLVADPRDEPRPPFGVDLQTGVGQVLCDPLPHLATGARVHDRATDVGDGLGQRLWHLAPPLEDQPRRRQRVLQVVDQRLDELAALALLRDPPQHHADVGEQRRRLGGVDEAEQRVAVVGRCADVDLLDHQGSVLVADEVVHEEPHRVAEDDLVVALQQRDGDRRAPARVGHALTSVRAASTAAITSAVRRAPRTSWARRIRLPRAIPSAWAAWLASRRSSTVVPTRSPRNRLFDADRNSGQPREASRSWPRSSSSDCGSRLAEVEAGVDHHPLAGDPGRLGGLGPRSKEARDGVDHRLVVHGLGIGDPWPDADVGGHDRGTRGGRDRRGTRGRRTR